jgi:hypothetical protein
MREDQVVVDLRALHGTHHVTVIREKLFEMSPKIQREMANITMILGPKFHLENPQKRVNPGI